MESTPETMCKVEPYSYKPENIKKGNPPWFEGCFHQGYRADKILMSDTHEFFKLHFSPEVCKVECKESENDDTENKHIFRCPSVACTFIGYCISLISTSLQVGVREIECIDDVDNESGSKNRNHNGHNRQCHELTTRNKPFRIEDIQSIDSAVQEKEKYQEQTGNAHDYLLSDRRSKNISHFFKKFDLFGKDNSLLVIFIIFKYFCSQVYAFFDKNEE